MSQQPPDASHPFVPPPPPSPYGNSLFPPDVLASKAAYVAAEAKTALILSIIGFFFAGFIFGYIALKKANEVLETIQIYEVAQDKKSLTMTAKILAIVDIVGWIVGLILRFTVLS